MGCDMCGKSAELYRAIIEDAELNVCENCAKFGKVLGKQDLETISQGKKHVQRPTTEKVELIAENFADLIRKKREGLGLTQKEFAQKINEKESLIHKIETGSLEPSILLARKLEKMLKIKLVEDYEETHEKVQKKKEDGFTIGDFMN